MKLRDVLLTAGVLVAVVVCVRLGIWQLARWNEKKALNASTQAALAEEPITLAGAVDGVQTSGRRVRVRGHFDESRQILLYLRPHDGEPGVEVVTPLRLAGGAGAVLVNRGWMGSEDGAHARPQDAPEPGEREVIGVARSLRRGPPSPPIPSWTSDSIEVLSMRELVLAELQPRFPYPLAPLVVVELPGPGVPTRPLRRAPPPLDAGVHLGYSIQWFLIAAVLAGSAGAFARSRRVPKIAVTPRSPTT